MITDNFVHLCNDWTLNIHNQHEYTYITDLYLGVVLLKEEYSISFNQYSKLAYHVELVDNKILLSAT